MIIVIMGVSGCGKSTIGAALAQRLALPFVEGDDYHAATNIHKMANGIALTNQDRLPWIQAIAESLNRSGVEQSTEGDAYQAVLACSALSSFVREQLCQHLDQPCSFVHLHADPETIRARLKQRHGHFMAPELCDSQFAALQAPADAIKVDVTLPSEEIVDWLVDRFAGSKG